MAVKNGYITLPDLKAALGDLDHDGNDAQYERAIEAASRQIDSWYGGQFWKEPTPVARLFRAENPHMVWTGDLADTTGLIVKTDDDGDGVFETTWTSAEWQAEPFVRINNRPYQQIVAVGGRCFPTRRRHDEWRHTIGMRPRVQVTASWGWPAVPDEVEQACQILAVDHFKSKDLTGGIAGFGDFGPIRIASFNPQAKALLEPLRVPVFA